MAADTARRQILQTLSILSTVVIAGCASMSGETGPPGENDSLTSNTTNPWKVDDIRIKNESETVKTLEIDIQPVVDTEDRFTRNITVQRGSTEVFANVDAMDTECKISIRSSEGVHEEYTFEGDASDGHKGVTVRVYSDEIEFHEVVA